MAKYVNVEIPKQLYAQIEDVAREHKEDPMVILRRGIVLLNFVNEQYRLGNELYAGRDKTVETTIDVFGEQSGLQDIVEVAQK